MAAVNYAEKYERALAQAYPNVLNFGELYNVANNSIYTFLNAKTIHIPSISVTGRKNVNRDAIDGVFQRNVDDTYEDKTMQFYREWSTSLDPADVDDTNMVLTIQNATKVFNETQKFPEKDAYTISKIFADWSAQGGTPNTTVLTVDNVLNVFDAMMEAMDEALVPFSGRLLYVTPAVKTLLKNASQIGLSRSVQSGANAINRVVDRLDEVTLNTVPSVLMKTAYNFNTVGYEVASGAQQVNMFLVHPSAIITPSKYSFVGVEAPAAGTKGDYIYYEKEYSDVFILNNRTAAIAFNIGSATGPKTLSSIAITTAPTKTTYNVGETFDPTGMVVTATYSDASTAVVDTYSYSPMSALTVADTEITVTVDGKSATQAITVTGE